jgi:hypothetical protein
VPIVLLPQSWAPGVIIPSSWANNIGYDIALLDERTGHDPGGAQRFLASTDPTHASWRLLNQNDFPTPIIPSAAMIDQKVNIRNRNVAGVFGAYTSFAEAAAAGSAFFDVSATPTGPNPTNSWLAIQNRHWNWEAGNFGWQLAVAFQDYENIWVRGITNSTPTPWRKLWHEGNLDPLLRSGGVMTGPITFQDTLEGLILAGSTQIRDDVATNLFQILANGGHAVIYNENGSVILLDLQAAQATFPGVVQGTGFSAPTGNIVAAAGNIQATAGTVTGTRLISTVTTGTAPLQVASQTLVTSLNAELVGGRIPNATAGAGRIPIADAAGKLDAWVSTPASFPTGIIAMWDQSPSLIPPGWLLCDGGGITNDMRGRLPVGAGTTFSVTFAVGSTYGTSWQHQHSTPSHSHSGAPMSVGGTTGEGDSRNGKAVAGGVTLNEPTHAHTFNAGVAGNTANDGSSNTGFVVWLPAMYSVHFIEKV